MKIIIQNVLQLFIVALFISCEINTDVVIDELPTGIVAEATLDQDSTFAVKLTYSLPLTGDAQSNTIPDAVVTIEEDDANVYTLLYQLGRGYNIRDNQNYYVAARGLKPQPGKKYKLKASAPGLKEITAYTELPASVPLQEVKFASKNIEIITQSSNTSPYPHRSGFVPIRLKFKDNPGKNYYEILVFEINRRSKLDQNGKPVMENGEYVFIDEKPRPLPTYSYNKAFNSEEINELGAGYHKIPSLLFSDDTFEDNTVTVDLLAHLNGIVFSGPSPIKSLGFIKLVVAIRHVSRDYFLFHRTFLQYTKVNDNWFAEPVSVYNNVKDGFGIFAGYAKDKVILDPKDNSNFE
jgi:Domain of unknown function (DUF4249)